MLLRHEEKRGCIGTHAYRWGIRLDDQVARRHVAKYISSPSLANLSFRHIMMLRPDTAQDANGTPVPLVTRSPFRRDHRPSGAIRRSGFGSLGSSQPRDGFQPRNTPLNLDGSLEARGRYCYEISAPEGVDILTRFEPREEGQEEVAFTEAISSSLIRNVTEYDGRGRIMAVWQDERPDRLGSTPGSRLPKPSGHYARDGQSLSPSHRESPIQQDRNLEGSVSKNEDPVCSTETVSGSGSSSVLPISLAEKTRIFQSRQKGEDSLAETRSRAVEDGTASKDLDVVVSLREEPRTIGEWPWMRQADFSSVTGALFRGGWTAYCFRGSLYARVEVRPTMNSEMVVRSRPKQFERDWSVLEQGGSEADATPVGSPCDSTAYLFSSKSHVRMIFRMPR